MNQNYNNMLCQKCNNKLTIVNSSATFFEGAINEELNQVVEKMVNANYCKNCDNLSLLTWY